jgi:putative transposase
MNQKTLSNSIKDLLENEIDRIFQKHGCTIVNYDFHQNCAVKISFEAPPHKECSVIINNFKTVTSRLIQKTYPNLLAHSNNKKFWSQDYYLLTETVIDINDVLEKVFEEK